MSGQRLPFYVVGVMWAVIVIANLILYPTLPAPPSVFAIGMCGAATFLILLPSLVARDEKPEVDHAYKSTLFSSYREWLAPVVNRVSMVVVCGTLIGTGIDYLLSGGMPSTASLSEIRAAHITEGVEYSPLRYLSLVAKSLGLLSLGHLAVTRPPRGLLLAGITVSLIAGLIETATYGGRSFLRTALTVVMAGFLVGNGKWIIQRRLRVGVAVAILGFVFLIVNVAFNRMRVTNENDYMATVKSGDMLAEAVGLGNLPSDASFGLGLIVGYVLTPMGYFDHFLKVHDLPPAYGAFTFQTIGGRFGYDFFAIKQRVDEYYEDFGISYNIWATSYRELMIDTGPWLFLPVCAVIGFALLYFRRKAFGNPGFLGLYLLLVSWLLNSPFESIFKTRYVEFAFMLSGLLAVSWAVGEAISAKARITSERSQVQSEAEMDTNPNSTRTP